MKKTWAILKISMMDALQYKMRGIIWGLYDIVPPIIMMYFWAQAFATQPLIQGRNREQLIGYYLIAGIVRALLIPHPQFQIARQINKGEINVFLLKPTSYLQMWFLYELSYKINRVLVVLIGLPVFYYLTYSLIGSPLTLTVTFGGLIVVGLSFYLVYLIKYLIGLSAFWFTEVGWLIGLTELTSLFLAGQLMPLYLMPQSLATVAGFLPFQFETYIPVQIFLGEIRGAQVLTMIALQSVWIVLLYLLATFLWKRGLKGYSAYSG